MSDPEKDPIPAAKLAFWGVSGAALIGLLGTVSVPFINHYFARDTPPHQTQPLATPDAVTPRVKQSPKKQAPTPASSIQNENDSLDDVNQIGQVSGTGNQITQISGGNSGSIVINPVAPVSSHPLTFGMGLKWTADGFAETVRNGNLPAIKEYLNPKDGFDPNTLWNGNEFVLQLPIFEGTKNFPAILELFKQTDKLDWNQVNDRSVFGSLYHHPITEQWALLQEAANKNRPADLKALIDAGANPSQLISDEIMAFNAPPSGTVMYKGKLTGRARDMSGAHAEQELAAFKSVGYSLPGLEQAIEDASRSPAACDQEIKSHHTIKEAMELAHKQPQVSSGQVLKVEPFQGAVSYLRNKLRFGPSAWQGDEIEYARAIATACSPTGTF